ncbi:hypothetical protein EYF80_037136 [Liparis tanakae]|uniref:Uncharacterized protein n=1 Tax=Liparis tanakae TaxID=230148 RepID=A0A4Z2GHP9_9TELE|nr:hypothetical protein EYF80_037136 [Liparis tanakae]
MGTGGLSRVLRRTPALPVPVSCGRERPWTSSQRFSMAVHAMALRARQSYPVHNPPLPPLPSYPLYFLSRSCVTFSSISSIRDTVRAMRGHGRSRPADPDTYADALQRSTMCPDSCCAADRCPVQAGRPLLVENVQRLKREERKTSSSEPAPSADEKAQRDG